MAKRLQLRRGTATEHNTFTGAIGEVTVDTTNKTLRVHDGTTAGGTRLATLTGGLVPVSQLPDATTSVKGVVVLNDTITSTSTTQALTAAQGKVLADRDVGYGQTYTNVTGSRAFATDYTNNTGKLIFVFVTTDISAGGRTLGCFVDGDNVLDVQNDGDNPVNATATIPVPHGSTYKFTSNGLLSSWWELR